MFTINEKEPTSILKDFAVFTEYLKTHRIVLTKVNEFISGKNLIELNRQMTAIVPYTVARTTQDYYPLLHLFYHLVLGGRLFQKFSEKDKIILKPTNRLQLYNELKVSPFPKINTILEKLGKKTPDN